MGRNVISISLLEAWERRGSDQGKAGFTLPPSELQAQVLSAELPS